MTPAIFLSKERFIEQSVPQYRVTNVVVSCVNDPPHATVVSASGGNTCTLLQDGTINCWGLNNNGQLGNGTMTHSAIPVVVSGIP